MKKRLQLCRRSAIATSIIPQEQTVNLSKPHPSKDISSPVPANSVPVVPKKLSQEELNAIEDELKRLRINPESCVSVIKKYWDNVGGAMPAAGASPSLELRKRFSKVGVPIRQDYSLTAARRGLSLKKSQVSNEVNEWFTWARGRRIVLAMTDGWVYTPDGEAVRVEEMMQKYPLRE